jgi:hypothetical protein
MEFLHFASTIPVHSRSIASAYVNNDSDIIDIGNDNMLEFAEC